MLRTTDQTGRSVEIPDFPERIISLVPSQTELLHDLGLGDRVVGITKFCVHPAEWFKSKPRVGGTKILKHNAIASLEPDLIIGNKEENTREDIEQLASKYPVWVSDVSGLNSAISMIKSIGQITQAKAMADTLVKQIEGSFTDLKPKQKFRTAYLIWRKPYMAVGVDTFINDMLEHCGFENVVKQSRYPELRVSDLVHLDPELVLFSSEPYPFKEQHLEQLAQHLPHAKLQLVNGEPFSWYGSRLLTSVPYFNKLLEIIS